MLVGLNLIFKTISESDSAFPLKGMINACFQNNGESPVWIGGSYLESGDSFPILTNGLELQNTVAIDFTDNSKTKNLVVNYLVKTEVKPCSN